MRPNARSAARSALALALAVAFAPTADAARNRRTPLHEPIGQALYASPQSNPIAVNAAGTRVYVANTTSHSVDVINTGTGAVIITIDVGLDPVSVAIRPDGAEVWVANHISDSVSVIDPTSLEIIATIQDFDGNGATLFDEPVGIAFASNTKAFVALSSTNEIAIVDISGGNYTVRAQRIQIPAQEPRAIAVDLTNDRLYVAAFESGNQSEISLCPAQANPNPTVDPQCTLGSNDVQTFAINPNLPGEVKNIIRDPDLPDRDVFVYDSTDPQDFTPDDVISGVGSLLYGVAVHGDIAYVTQTEARNDINGVTGDFVAPFNGFDDGDVDQDGVLALADLENRIFLNQLARVDCSGGGACVTTISNLGEQAPGTTVTTPMATPYGVATSADGTVLVITLAASSRIATVNASTLAVLDTLDVGSVTDQAIPRGVAFDSSGATGTAYVLNTLDNTVEVVTVGAAGALSFSDRISVGNDPTPEDVRLGRIVFNTAAGSSNGTFACAGCHPDGNNDQLLWRIGGECFLAGCIAGEAEVRSTMPIRGLANSLPLHWDGTLGDPFGGGNGAVGVGGAGGTDCVANNPHGCFEDLAEESLSGVMCDQTGACPAGGVFAGGPEISQMASFLANVSYPPARSRRMDDTVSNSALNGFADFFLNINDQAPAGIETCADNNSGCHALPLGADTNSAILNGFDVPTMRGMTDRFLLFSLGFPNAEESLVLNQGQTNFDWDPAVGMDEVVSFAAAFPAVFTPVYGVIADDIFQMFEEASTGPSGALGRQASVNATTAAAGAARTALEAQLDELEAADNRGVVNLRGEGFHLANFRGFSFKQGLNLWQVGPNQMTQSAMLDLAAAGNLTVTVTAHLKENMGDSGYPQPLLGPATGATSTTGEDPLLPRWGGGGGGNVSAAVEGFSIRSDARVFVNGVRQDTATISCDLGGIFFPFCTTDVVTITIPKPANGLHLLQVQNTAGPFSNELPICVGNTNSTCENP